jgi:YgiT-type zinc finger domain-containing protein
MSAEPLREGRACPICSLNGTLRLEHTSESELIDGHTVVVHGVPTLVCDRCGIEVFDEDTTRRLEAFYDRATRDRARTLVIDFDDIEPRAAAS